MKSWEYNFIILCTDFVLSELMLNWFDIWESWEFQMIFLVTYQSDNLVLLLARRKHCRHSGLELKS